jgi:DNA-binding MarR family transcriptional regulator
MRALVRRAGWLSPDRTACGIELPPSHAHALMILADAGAPIVQRELAAELGLDKSSIARLCQRLEEVGHVAMERDRENARFVRVELTAKGRRAAEKIDGASASRHERLMSAIPRGERANVLRALEVLGDALGALREEAP